MSETKKRIESYKKALPHLKERVVAVAVLLAISLAMMTSATFAWMTLSRNPEVSSIPTTISTNGNLEIALSNPSGTQPADTAIGDGGRDIMQTNLTWGNLINLSDPRYGLQDIVLRPASLYTKTLATKPMYAVQYGPDGRVLGYLYNFKYTNYVENEDGVMHFAPTDETRYGVRAISTVTFEDVSGDAVLMRKIEELETALIQAKLAFKNIYDIDNSAEAERYMTAVGGLVGVHVDKTMNGGSPDAAAYMTSLYDLTNAFLTCVVDMGEILVEAANLCVFMSLEDRADYDDLKFTFQDLISGNMTNEDIEERCDDKYDVNFSCMEDFGILWKKLAGSDNIINGVDTNWSPVDENGAFIQALTLPSYNAKYDSPTSKDTSTWGAYEVILAKYQNYRQRVMAGAADQTVPWDNWMIMAVNQMCDMESATIRAGDNPAYTADDLMDLKADRNISQLTPFTGNGPFYAVINDGAIQDVGQLLGEPLNVPSNPSIRIKAGVTIASISYTMNIDMQPNISAAYDSKSNNLIMDVEEAKNVSGEGSFYQGDATAAETYAMVLDFWVRTNAGDSLLTLEGELVYDQLAGTDSTGMKKGLLYSYTYTNPDTEEDRVYYIYWDQDKYYFDFEREGHNDELTAEQVEMVKEDLEPVYSDKPSGYQGVNRVWSDLDDPNNVYAQQVLQNSGISTTQGSGSCYIFYPQSPEDQQQSLELLAAMRVAFADENGVLLAMSYLDTENIVEDSGRVIVPLRLRANEKPLLDGSGATIDKYITPMYRNEAMRISAIVYLEGDHLTNNKVLATGTITGQMNIQFGTTDLNLTALEDQNVMKQYYTFDFSLDGNRDGMAELGKNYEIPEGDAWKIDLNLNLGTAAVPRKVEGNFVSVINATQGASQPTFAMNYDEATGMWKATVSFTGPGNYQLRSIRIDGVDYALKEEQIIRVKVPGTSISSVIWQDQTGTDDQGIVKSYRTADTMKQEVLRLVLQRGDGSGSGFPEVRGVFLGDNGQNIAVLFNTTNGTDYTGTATFTTGGHYELTYVYVDGTLMRLDPEWYKTIDLQLGLKVEIGYTAPRFVVSNPDKVLTDEQKSEILKDQKITPQSCYFRFNAPMARAEGVYLEIDVWCKIYDDQDNQLKDIDLSNPALFFGTGYNGLDTDLTWSDENGGCYKGTFTISGNGTYRFSYVELSDGSTITRATTAPTITSASAYAVEYVHDRTFYNTDLVYELGLSGEQRVLQFKLKNSLGTTMKVALSRTPTEAASYALTRNGSEPIIVSNMDGWNNQGVVWKESQPDASGVVTYTLKLPSDGYWEIIGLYLGGGAHYGGELWTGETDEDWADLSELVQSDNISAYYLTEVSLETSDLPNIESMRIDFMQTVSSTTSANRNVYHPTIVLKNQGRLLADVLTELKEQGYDIDPEIVIDYYYTYSRHNEDAWEISDTSKLPTTVRPALNANGVNEIAFIYEGVYEPHFSITVGGKAYTGSVPAELSKTLRVYWNMPDVYISGVSDEGVAINVEDSNGDVVTGVVKNYYEDYFASTYFKQSGSVIILGNSFTAPQVTLTVRSGKGAASSVSIAASGSNYSKTFTLNQSNGWSQTQNVGSTTNGGYTRQVANDVVIKTIVLTDGNANYTFTLPTNKQITIKNQAYPHSMTIQTSTTEVGLPAQIECIDYNGNTFTQKTNGANSVRIFSPDGRAFSVVLPTLTRVVSGRNEDILEGDPVYDDAYGGETGVAVSDFMYAKVTTTSGCNTTTTYPTYQRYERRVQKNGTQKIWEDTYTMDQWSAGAAGTTVKISTNTTISATGTVKVSSRVISTGTLVGTWVTEYKYVDLGDKDAAPSGNKVTQKTSESEIGPIDWMQVQ